MHLLICDDDIKICQHLADKLKSRLNVYVSHSKNQALKICETIQIDILLADYFLNDGNGLEIAAEIRKQNPNVKIILISGAATKEMAIKSIDLKVNSLIEKPFTVSEVENKINEILSSEDASSKLKINLNAKDFLLQINEFKVVLTPTEYKIINLLLQNIDRRTTRLEISQKIWGNQIISENTFDTHLGNIKKKMGPYSNILSNIKGAGYALDL